MRALTPEIIRATILQMYTDLKYQRALQTQCDAGDAGALFVVKFNARKQGRI